MFVYRLIMAAINGVVFLIAVGYISLHKGIWAESPVASAVSFVSAICFVYNVYHAVKTVKSILSIDRLNDEA